MHNNTGRFSNRVADYIKYRPGYPAEIIPFLEQQFGISPADTIADIGTGTGISARMFLEKGYRVTGVEPNDEMRQAAIEQLKTFERFSITAGTGEHTLLQSGSVNIIIAAQAFHWFNNDDTKTEFKRILRPPGLVVFIWNERMTVSAFEKEYDELIVKHAIDYVKVDHRNIDTESIQQFFAPAACGLRIFDNHQDFDFEGLKGRLLSSSYMPDAAHEGYPAMVSDLRELFDRYQQNDLIRINYETKVYTGQLMGN